MSKKTIIITIAKAIIELAGIILLILLIVYLIKSDNGILAKINAGTAQEKLDTAIKTFSSTDGMELKTALEAIEGLDDLQINNETGEYNIKIDGQDFLVVSREIIPEEEQNNIVNEKKEEQNSTANEKKEEQNSTANEKKEEQNDSDNQNQEETMIQN